MNKYLVLILFGLLSCSGGSLTLGESYNQSVLVTKKSGESLEGVVVDINSQEILLLKAKTKVMVKILETDIKNIQRSKTHYDLEGYVISESVYNEEKESQNSVWYSVIGGLSGGLLGALVAGPIGGTKDALVSGLAIGMIGGAYYGYTVGDETDIIKAVEKVKTKRKALKNLEKEIQQ